MILVNQDVPPEFAEALAELLSVLPSAPDTPFAGRTRKKARQKLTNYTIRDQLSLIRQACDLLAQRVGLDPDSGRGRDFVGAQTINLLNGYFDPKYWNEQPITSEQTIASEPDNVPAVSPPPYSYRTTENLPSTVTYAAGTASSGNPAIAGSTIDAFFDDTLLKWRRYVIKLDEPILESHGEPTFLQLDATMSIDADARGSRPMTSILVHVRFGPVDTLDAFDAAPPLTKCLSFYWRYKPPTSSYPYYHVTHERTLVARLIPKFPDTTLGPLRDLALSIFPRPMFGKGFNNNTYVSVELAPTLKVYQITRWRRLADGPPRTNHQALWDEAALRMLIFTGEGTRTAPAIPGAPRAPGVRVPPSPYQPEILGTITSTGLVSYFGATDPGDPWRAYVVMINGGLSDSGWLNPCKARTITHDYQATFAAGVTWNADASPTTGADITGPYVTADSGWLPVGGCDPDDPAPPPDHDPAPPGPPVITYHSNGMPTMDWNGAPSSSTPIRVQTTSTPTLDEIEALPGGIAVSATVENIDLANDRATITYYDANDDPINAAHHVTYSTSGFADPLTDPFAYQPTSPTSDTFDLTKSNSLWQYVPALNRWTDLGEVPLEEWLALVAALGATSIGPSHDDSPTSATTGDTTVTTPDEALYNYRGSIDGTPETAIGELWYLAP